MGKLETDSASQAWVIILCQTCQQQFPHGSSGLRWLQATCGHQRLLWWWTPGTRAQSLQSTGDRPQTLYQIFQSDLNGDKTGITRVQSSHTSPTPHTESFIGSKSGEETEHISSWECLFHPGHCEALSPLKRETGHRFLTDTEIHRPGVSEKESVGYWEVRSVLIMSPWNIAGDTLHRDSGLSCFVKTPEL